MTKRDFFIALIRVFGLFSIITSIFAFLPSITSYIITYGDDFLTSSMPMLFVAIGSMLIVIGLFVLLIFKSDKIVSLLKLDKGFDGDTIDFGSLTSTNIIQIGTFVIGGLLLVNHTPVLLSHIFFMFKDEIAGLEQGVDNTFTILLSGIKVIVGFLLLTNYKLVAYKLKSKKEI
ncbi:hypothetical protein MHTCC0001_32000 [Flavobacteriaceae bacterium MHTCC 0001]